MSSYVSPIDDATPVTDENWFSNSGLPR